jgi:hypothetical protein
MAGGDRRKCKCCLELFRPDPRNRHHCVTRCLNGATHLSRCRNSQCGAVTLQEVLTC